jgi:signal peptidase I
MSNPNSDQPEFRDNYLDNLNGSTNANHDQTPDSGDNSAPTPKPKRESWLRTVARLFVIWLVCFLFLRFVIPSYDVQGASMLPTYNSKGDRVLTDQLLFKLFDKPNRGDVIVLNKPSDTKQDNLIKRVVGLPGEKLEIRQGIVYINGRALNEPYVENRGFYDYPATTLPADCYFVLGDNRPVSLDSHYFGCIKSDTIQARVLLRYPWHF